ncbi:F-box protein CPR30 [Tripterygium wilfordii]|uniref:F-box protein CPR30 n=1 Tax=Tripterygium wilfordii TaxID=458696 RepID=A0A7J7C0M4_TRIWF|nr:F-box protein CPR30 [Tripterygium wilfordii]
MDILSRLSAKSLVRFKSVSKPWKSLVDDPCFINMHMLIRAKTKQLILQLEPTEPILSMELDSLDKAQTVNLQPELETSYKYITVIGSCNGLLALYCCNNNSGEEDIVICNIATREHKTIPILMPFAGHTHVGEGIGGGLGFGYDEVGDFEPLSGAKDG